jgi:hypothetical protein
LGCGAGCRTSGRYGSRYELSYTSFEYSGLAVSADETITTTFTVTFDRTGKVAR